MQLTKQLQQEEDKVLQVCILHEMTPVLHITESCKDAVEHNTFQTAEYNMQNSFLLCRHKQQLIRGPKS